MHPLAGSEETELWTFASMVSRGLVDFSTGISHFWPKPTSWKPVATLECESCHMLTGEFEEVRCIEFEYLGECGEANVRHPGERWLWTSCGTCGNLMGIHIDLVQEFVGLCGAFFDLEGCRAVFVNLPSAPRLPWRTYWGDKEARIRAWIREQEVAATPETLGSSVYPTRTHEDGMNLAVRRGKQPPRPVTVPELVVDDEAVQGRL